MIRKSVTPAEQLRRERQLPAAAGPALPVLYAGEELDQHTASGIGCAQEDRPLAPDPRAQKRMRQQARSSVVVVNSTLT